MGYGFQIVEIPQVSPDNNQFPDGIVVFSLALDFSKILNFS